MSSLGEEVRRAMRSVENAELPLIGDRGNQFRRESRAGCSSRSAGGLRCNTSPAIRARPPWPPNLPEREGRATAQIVRHVEAAANREIGAAAGSSRGAHAQRCAGRHAHRRPEVDRAAVEVGVHRRAGQANERIGVEFERRPGHGDLERRGIVRVADGAIAPGETTGYPSVPRAARRRSNSRAARDSPGWSSACRR